MKWFWRTGALLGGPPARFRKGCENMADKAKKPDFLMYKGKPLVRSGNTLYYGNMADK